LRPLRKYRKLNTGQIRTYEGKYGNLRANTDICPVFALRTNNQHWLSYYWTCKNEHIATKYVINMYIDCVYGCYVHIYWLCIWVGCYVHVCWLCIWVPYICILIVHMGAMYMHIDCVYRCYIYVCRLCKWVLYTCILIVYMGAMYMYIDSVYGCHIHVYWLCIWVLFTLILIVYMHALNVSWLGIFCCCFDE
jgi:hypothetical protein